MAAPHHALGTGPGPRAPVVPPRRPGRVATLLVALLPAAACLVLGEVVLGVLRPADQGPPLSRGFDPTAAYLVPDPDVPGGYLTQMFDGQKPEVRIAPRDHRRRVLLFGGSNTETFPPAVLEYELNRRLAGDDRPFEVVNLGRSGYGSERASILFEQAMALDPELVVIYSGHNEFIEAGFRQELDDHLSGPVRIAADAAAHLRTFQTLCDVLRPAGVDAGREAANRPEAANWDFARFQDQTYDQTLERFERYRQHLRSMLALADKNGVPAVLCTVISNPLTAPFSSTFDPTVPAERREQAQIACERALALVPERYRMLFEGGGNARVHVLDWARPPKPWPDDEPLPALRRWPRTVRAGLLLMPPPEAWSEKARQVLRAQAAFFARDGDAEDLEALRSAREQLAAALKLAPDYPMAHYRLGLVQHLLGETALATEHLYESARFDRAPRKGNDVSNGIVRALARAHAGVQLFDAEALYRERAPDGLIGYELMKDECHLHDKVYVVLMHDLADVILPSVRATDTNAEAESGR
ncbi:MAG: hypothetical protein GC161_16190 [Planctomycetaceae bacterium]|nr:hypothetical protein [Planctomycetaceae bacterium]